MVTMVTINVDYYTRALLPLTCRVFKESSVALELFVLALELFLFLCCFDTLRIANRLDCPLTVPWLVRKLLKSRVNAELWLVFPLLWDVAVWLCWSIMSALSSVSEFTAAVSCLCLKMFLMNLFKRLADRERFDFLRVALDFRAASFCCLDCRSKWFWLDDLLLSLASSLFAAVSILTRSPKLVLSRLFDISSLLSGCSPLCLVRLVLFLTTTPTESSLMLVLFRLLVVLSSPPADDSLNKVKSNGWKLVAA